MTNNEYIITKFGQNMYFNRFFEKKCEKIKKHDFSTIFFKNSDLPRFSISGPIFGPILTNICDRICIVDIFLKTNPKSTYFLLWFKWSTKFLG